MINFKLLKSQLHYSKIEKQWHMEHLVQGHPLWRFCCQYCEQHGIYNIYLNKKRFQPATRKRILKRLTYIINNAQSQNPVITQYKHLI